MYLILFFVLGSIVDCVFNSNEATSSTAFSYSAYSHLKVKRFPFGDILEHKQ